MASQKEKVIKGDWAIFTAVECRLSSPSQVPDRKPRLLREVAWSLLAHSLARHGAPDPGEPCEKSAN